MRRILTLLGEGEIGLTNVEHSPNSALMTWGTAMLAASSFAAGIILASYTTPLGDFAFIPAAGFVFGGAVLVLHLIASCVRAFCSFRDERDAAHHTARIAALKIRRLSIQVSTVTIPVQPKPIVVRNGSGATFEMQPDKPTLIDVGAVECKTQAIAFLRASEAVRPSTDRPDRIMRWDKLGPGFSPEAWTRARDSLQPLIESNPPGLPRGTYCVATEFMTVADMIAGLEDGRILPSPSGAVLLHETST